MLQSHYNYYYFDQRSHDHNGTRASRLLQRQQTLPSLIFRYTFPKDAFTRTTLDHRNLEHFGFPPSSISSPDRQTTLHDRLPEDLTQLLNSIVIPDDPFITAGYDEYDLLDDDNNYWDTQPPPPLHLDASKPIPGLDLSDVYLASLHSDYTLGTTSFNE